MKNWALAVLCLTACSGGSSRPDQFTIKHEESVDVGGGPGLPVLLPAGLDPGTLGPGLKQDFTTELGNTGAQPGDVKSVQVSLLRLEVTAPIRNGMPAQDLRFLDSLTLYVKTNTLPEVKVADSLPPTTGTQSASFGRDVFTVDIPVLGTELKDYVTSDSMATRVEIAANGRPAFSCTIKYTTELAVKLNPVQAAKNRLF